MHAYTDADTHTDRYTTHQINKNKKKTDREARASNYFVTIYGSTATGQTCFSLKREFTDDDKHGNVYSGSYEITTVYLWGLLAAGDDDYIGTSTQPTL